MLSAQIMTTLHRYVLIALLCVLSGCGVRVEIAETRLPTPTPRALPRYTYKEGVTRQQAEPRIVFTDSAQPQVDLFMNPDQPDVYVVQNRMLWLTAAYDVMWFASPQSNAQVRLNVYKRDTPEDTWELYDSVEHNLVTDTLPTSTNDTVGTGIYVEQTGTFEVRAEVGIVAYPANGEIVNQIGANEFHVVVVNDPGDIEFNYDALIPRLDGFDSRFLLADWRSWDDTLCDLSQAEGDLGYEPLAAACDAFSNGDLQGALDNLSTSTFENPALAASASSALGFIALRLYDLDTASAAFQDAVSRYEMLGETLLLSACLHNLAAAQLMQDEPAAAESTLLRLQELRSQFWDEAGVNLTDANTAYKSADRSTLENAYWYFENAGLPQADVIGVWLAEQPAE